MSPYFKICSYCRDGRCKNQGTLRQSARAPQCREVDVHIHLRPENWQCSYERRSRISLPGSLIFEAPGRNKSRKILVRPQLRKETYRQTPSPPCFYPHGTIDPRGLGHAFSVGRPVVWVPIQAIIKYVPLAFFCSDAARRLLDRPPFIKFVVNAQREVLFVVVATRKHCT